MALRDGEINSTYRIYNRSWPSIQLHSKSAYDTAWRSYDTAWRSHDATTEQTNSQTTEQTTDMKPLQAVQWVVCLLLIYFIAGSHAGYNIITEYEEAVPETRTEIRYNMELWVGDFVASDWEIKVFFECHAHSFRLEVSLATTLATTRLLRIWENNG